MGDGSFQSFKSKFLYRNNRVQGSISGSSSFHPKLCQLHFLPKNVQKGVAESEALNVAVIDFVENHFEFFGTKKLEILPVFAEEGQVVVFIDLPPIKYRKVIDAFETFIVQFP